MPAKIQLRHIIAALGLVCLLIFLAYQSTLGPAPTEAISVPLQIDVDAFVPVDPNAITAPDARPLAVLNAATAQSATGAAVIFDGYYDSAQPEPYLLGGPTVAPVATPGPLYGMRIYFGTLAAVRYSLPKGDVVIITIQLSPDAANLGLNLGEETTLPGGMRAWVIEKNPSALYPNRVTLRQNSLIIVLASPQALEDLKLLATQVELR